MPTRLFPPPWTVEDIDAAFVVRDQNGQGLAYVYYEEEPQRRVAANLLTKDEARRRIAGYRLEPRGSFSTPSQIMAVSCITCSPNAACSAMSR
jgi:hypothetical protein